MPPADPPQLRALLDDKRYDELTAHLTPRLDAALTDLPAYRALNRDLRKLVRSAPLSVDPFDAWVASSQHGVAYLVRGEFLLAQAWQARGSKAGRQTSRDNFARMDQLMAAARSDFQDALRKLGKRCDRCHAGLLESHMAQRQRPQAVATLDEAMLAMGGGLRTPVTYLGFLQPRWGGSWEQMEDFVARFARDHPGSPGATLLRGAYQAHLGDAWLADNQPQKAQFLLEEGLRIDPGNSYLWERLASAAMAQSNSDLVMQASAKALEGNPDSIDALNARAFVLQTGKTPLDAVPLLERSVALGNEWALQALLPMVALGKHGYKPDRSHAERICQSAIDAFSPTGYACMGHLHFFGMGRPVDKPRALHWFVQAADRGVEAAMVDAGIMLWQGDGGPRDPQRAIDYWLRAREAGEPRADGKLRAHLGTWDYAWRVTLPGHVADARHFVDEGGAPLWLALKLAGYVLGTLLLILVGALVSWLVVSARRRRRAPGH